jgi:hypothetical protein
MLLTWAVLVPLSAVADEPAPKGSQMICGSCPSGTTVTGVTTAPEICKEGDPSLFECTALGTNLMSVCGSCPDGYRQVGSSMVPARCGSADGGRMTQCQLEKLESSLPDPAQGGVFCPPNCAGQMPTPGQGTIPPPPKYLPPPKESSQ